MFLKVIESYRNVVAICDEDLIGKKFGEGKFQLDVKENFFKEKEASEEEVIKIIQNLSKEDATFNIVGEKSINTAIKTGIISKKDVKEIQGVPFALILA